MSQLIAMQKDLSDTFEKIHQVPKLGFLSAFVKASALALQKVPSINACKIIQSRIYKLQRFSRFCVDVPIYVEDIYAIYTGRLSNFVMIMYNFTFIAIDMDTKDIVYHDYSDIQVVVASEKGYATCPPTHSLYCLMYAYV
jgi:pyruvate/2-oxoglutarate dehydrogenase complex dihydrolipoamide acyltransferase (E2) component